MNHQMKNENGVNGNGGYCCKRITKTPTVKMYEAGVEYLKNKGTAWCVNDLFSVMWSVAETIHLSDCGIHPDEDGIEHKCDCFA